MRSRYCLLLLAAPVLFRSVVLGQTSPAPRPQAPAGEIATHPEWPKASPSDVDSVEHLVAAASDVLSGPPGRQRDWTRFRSLFLPNGRLGQVLPDRPAKDGRPARSSDVAWLTLDDYVERLDPFSKTIGFFERTVAIRTEAFGNLTEVWSTYEVRRSANDAKPYTRGINSLQVVRARGRFWIASEIWDDELNGFTLPEKYLTSPRP